MTDQPVTEFIEMLERDPEFDRSEPLSEQAEALLCDLIARAERAETALRIENLGRDSRTARFKHLESKGEGVKLVIGYMQEELRMAALHPEVRARRAARLAGENAEAIHERNKERIVATSERIDDLAARADTQEIVLNHADQ